MVRDRMQDMYEDTRMQNSSSSLMAFVLGAAAGAAVALLYAPGTGSESRTRLKEGARRLRDTAGDRLGDARHAVADGASTVKDVIGTGKEVVRESVAAGRDTLNRLRETADQVATTASRDL